MENQPAYGVVLLATPPPLTNPLTAALAEYEGQAQLLADAVRPGLRIALSIDTTERGLLYMLFTYDGEHGRASYLHRTAVGVGYTPEEALHELRLSLALRYAPYSEVVTREYPGMAELAADSAIAHAKEALPDWA